MAANQPFTHGGASHHRLEQLLQKVGVADVAGYSRLMKMDEGSALSDGSDERGRLTAATPYQKPEASSARRETTLQREIAVKNVSLGIFDLARCRRNPDFWVVFRQNPARC